MNTPETGYQITIKNLGHTGFQSGHIGVFITCGREIAVDNFRITDKKRNQNAFGAIFRKCVFFGSIKQLLDLNLVAMLQWELVALALI